MSRSPTDTRPGASHMRSTSTTITHASPPEPHPALFPLRTSNGDLSRPKTTGRLPSSVLRQGVPISSVGATGRRAWNDDDPQTAHPTAMTSATTFESDEPLLTALPKSSSASIGGIGQLSITDTPRSTVPETAEGKKSQAEMIVGIPRTPAELRRRAQLQQARHEQACASPSRSIPVASSCAGSIGGTTTSPACVAGSIPTPISATTSISLSNGGTTQEGSPIKGLRNVMSPEELKQRMMTRSKQRRPAAAPEDEAVERRVGR